MDWGPQPPLMAVQACRSILFLDRHACVTNIRFCKYVSVSCVSTYFGKHQIDAERNSM